MRCKHRDKKLSKHGIRPLRSQCTNNKNKITCEVQIKTLLFLNTFIFLGYVVQLMKLFFESSVNKWPTHDFIRIYLLFKIENEPDNLLLS